VSPHRSSRRIVAGVVAGGVVLAVAGAALLAPAGRSASIAIKPGFPGGPYFVFGCNSSHTNNDDAIVFAGRPGRSHNHTYIGNRTTNAGTTAASLLGKPTTCESDADASTYWFPTLYDYQDEVRPLSGIVYYVKRTFGDVAPLPAGLKIVAGNAKAKKRQAKEIVAWSCSGGRKSRYAVIPQCDEDDLLQLQVNFPNCWNGRALDSGNHKSHMKYAVAGNCPKSHPVAVPRIAIVLLYPPVSRYARVSSGKFATHADFINGWDQHAFEALVRELN
jgi:Domain of unknown function (DUF1996)